MKPKTVIFLDHAPVLGGAEVSLLLLLARLKDTHLRPILGCSEGALRAGAEEIGVQTVPLGFPRLRRSPLAPADWISGARTIRNAAITHGAECLYANTVRSAMYGALAARWSEIPFIWHMRDFWLSESAPRTPTFDTVARRLLAGASAAVIANSRAVAARFGRTDKVHIVPNGIDLARFETVPDTGAFKTEFQLPDQAPLIGTAGRLRPWKGQDVFLRVAARVLDIVPEAHFLVIGGTPFGVDDGYAQSLPRLARNLGLAEKVTFTGHLADIRHALAALDVFVHPGEPEPFGLVNIEAMALGKPVVGFNHGGLPEIVQHGTTGLLAPPGDEPALAAAVLDLLQDPRKAAAQGRAGRARVAAHFSIEKTALGVEKVLAQVLR